MKIYAIAPKNHMQLSLQSHGLFALAQFCDDKLYTKFFKENKKIKTKTMIDNGVVEHNQVSFDQLISSAKAVNADYIWCHDKLLHCEQTLALTNAFLSSLSNKEKTTFKFLMIPQGKTIDEYIYCYKQMVRMVECAGIVLSKYSVPQCFATIADSKKLADSRLAAIRYLISRKLINYQLYYHLGGADNSILRELRTVSQFEFINSIDSNIFIKQAVSYRKLNQHEQRLRFDFNCRLNDQQVTAATANIQQAKDLVTK